MLLRRQQRILLLHHGMALRVQLVRSLHRPILLHADYLQASLCFTVPEAGFELLASSPPHHSGDVQASPSHERSQDGHRTDGSAFLDERRHDRSAVFVAPEDLFIDSSRYSFKKAAKPAQHKQIVEKKDPFRYPAEGRAERAIASLLPRHTRKSTRQREKGVVVKPARAKERRVRRRSCDARGQLHVHFEAPQQL